MNKKITGLCLTAGLIISSVLPVQAETKYGDPGWSVTYNGSEKLESNFKTSSFNDVVKDIQPGDTVVLTVEIKNEDNAVTDWYMTNKIEKSLEEATTVANGGAYTYVLEYEPSDGDRVEFYNSDRVGGIKGKTDGDAAGSAGGAATLADEPDQSNASEEETGDTESTESVSKNNVGLHEATEALETEFLIDTLAKGQTGKITLTVTLEGETQGNDYQNTLADLTMEFAVERQPDPVFRRREPTHRTVVSGNEIIEEEDVPLGDLIRSNTVRTSDDNRLILFSLVTLTSGMALLLFALYCRKVGEKEEK